MSCRRFLCLDEPFFLPLTLFSYAKTLVVLKLTGYNIILDTPSSFFGFPSLKFLHFASVRAANPNSLSRFLSCCPILQDLFIEANNVGEEDWPDDWDLEQECNFNIIVSSLKRLHLSIDILRYQLELNTPALECLYFKAICLFLIH